MAMVPQKPVVFNDSVYHNVAYGLKVRGIARPIVEERVKMALGTVELSGYEHRNARKLSGGEMQRVALARAIVVEPEVLLLDEPTANLDPVSASSVDSLLSRIIEGLKTTVILATHDMSQGYRLASKVAVIMHGGISQMGPTREVFSSPSSKEIARLVGVENCLDGVVTASEGGLITVEADGVTIEAVSWLSVGKQVTVFIRPEDIVLAPARTSTSARNVLWGRVRKVAHQGPLARVDVECGLPLVVLVTRRSADDLGLREGSSVYASFKASGIHVIERG
jgi:tungstate transport system ATP-binding protein